MSLTQQQLDERIIGGSDLPVIMGLSPYKSALQLFLEKTGKMETPDISQNEAIVFGNKLEGVIADVFCERTGKKVRRVNSAIVNPEYPWLTAHIDRDVVGEEALLECKNSYAYNPAFGSDYADDIPDGYLIQVQSYLLATGYPLGYLAVALGGNRLKIYNVEKNDRLIKKIVTAGEDWMRRLKDNDAPDPVSEEDLKLLHPKASNRGLEVSQDMAQIISDIRDLTAQAKILESEIEEKKIRFKSVMADAEIATFGGQALATWKNQTRHQFYATEFKAAQPDLYEAFCKDIDSRVFRLAGGKGKN